ncbi:MAG: putative nucleotide-diphospho-sugar transferase [Bacteroidales bacterium]
MTFLYILTSNGKDEFIDMTYLSASFLRYLHTKANIVLITDSQSALIIKNSNHPLLKIINNVISIITPEGTQKWKSRYLKSHMRELISGDFLFLDSDTIPLKPLDKLFEIMLPIAAANNHSKDISTNFISYEKKLYDDLQWSYPNKHYLNTGVMFWKEDAKAYKLSKLFIHKWEQSQFEGYHYDQPAFNAALTEWDGEYYVLENNFNAQFRSNIKVSIDAKLWHFYSSNYNEIYKDYYSIGLEMIRKNKELDFKFIKKVTNSRIPFETNTKRQEEKIIKLINEKGENFSKQEYYLAREKYLYFFLHKYL